MEGGRGENGGGIEGKEGRKEIGRRCKAFIYMNDVQICERKK